MREKRLFSDFFSLSLKAACCQNGPGFVFNCSVDLDVVFDIYVDLATAVPFANGVFSDLSFKIAY